MKSRTLATTGQISPRGKLMLNPDELKQWCSQWENAQVIVTFEVVLPEASAALKAYYFKVVVPTMRQAFAEFGDRYTEEQTDLRLRQMSPVCQAKKTDWSNGKRITYTKQFADLNNSEAVEYIEFVKQLAAEEFQTYIEDPQQFTQKYEQKF